MARQKKPVHRVQMTEGKRNIIHQLLEEYDIQSAEDIQDALKDLLGGTSGFLDVLYHNLPGVLVMTGCLGVYLFSFRMGRKIVRIQV